MHSVSPKIFPANSFVDGHASFSRFREFVGPKSAFAIRVLRPRGDRPGGFSVDRKPVAARLEGKNWLLRAKCLEIGLFRAALVGQNSAKNRSFWPNVAVSGCGTLPLYRSPLDAWVSLITI